MTAWPTGFDLSHVVGQVNRGHARIRLADFPTSGNPGEPGLPW